MWSKVCSWLLLDIKSPLKYYYWGDAQVLWPVSPAEGWLVSNDDAQAAAMLSYYHIHSWQGPI